MKTCVEEARKRHGYKMQMTWISDGLAAVPESEELLSQFKQVVLTEVKTSFDLDLLKMIYKRIAEYSFKAFAKFTDKQDYCATSSANSLSNIELRKLVACGASGTNEKKKKEYNERKRSWHIMLREVEPTKAAASSKPKSATSTEREDATQTPSDQEDTTQTLKPPASKKSRSKKRTRAEMEAEYRAKYESALQQYDKSSGDISKLTKEQCCCVLFVAFEDYQSLSANKTNLLSLLINKIKANPEWRQGGSDEHLV